MALGKILLAHRQSRAEDSRGFLSGLTLNQPKRCPTCRSRPKYSINAEMYTPQDLDSSISQMKCGQCFVVREALSRIDPNWRGFHGGFRPAEESD